MKSLIKSLKNHIFRCKKFSSNEYWNIRYQTGGNSGAGSYNHLAEFKASVLNRLVEENKITSVIEFGCGDGNQLTLSHYREYAGYDISPDAVQACRKLFKDDSTKEFFLAQDYDDRKAQLALSLDVIFHLIEDDIFDAHMCQLFDSSFKYVVIYSSNQDGPIQPVVRHVRHRRFSSWIERERPLWQLMQQIPNPYPYNGDSTTTSFADFYIYKML